MPLIMLDSTFIFIKTNPMRFFSKLKYGRYHAKLIISTKFKKIINKIISNNVIISNNQCS